MWCGHLRRLSVVVRRSMHCAHKLDPSKPVRENGTSWRGAARLRPAYQARGFMISDTVVARLLKAANRIGSKGALLPPAIYRAVPGAWDVGTNLGMASSHRLSVSCCTSVPSIFIMKIDA